MRLPKLVNSEDWGLDNARTNAARAQEILSYNSETLRSYPEAELVRTSGQSGGLIALIRNQSLVDYEMRYEIAQRADLGRCATQIRVWRCETAIVSGLAKLVFEDIMLNEFDTLVSDREHTPAGMSYWRTRMAGLRMTKTVGLLNGEQIEIVSRFEYFETWLARVGGWGNEGKYRHLRFFISNLDPEKIVQD